MSLNIDDNGTITLYQGDSGEILISGLCADTNYDVYLAIKNKNREVVGNEIKVTTNHDDTVTFVLTADFTNLLKVSKNEPYEIYTYGIKACNVETGSEDTLFVEGKEYGDENLIIVYPKQVEGAV